MKEKLIKHNKIGKYFNSDFESKYKINNNYIFNLNNF